MIKNQYEAGERPNKVRHFRIDKLINDIASTNTMQYLYSIQYLLIYLLITPHIMPKINSL